MPNHHSEDAFQRYQKKQPYIDTFVHGVGGGQHEIGVKRVLSTLAQRFPKIYMQVGKEQGLTFVNKFDDVFLAALAIDCTLKHWQLKNALKHVSCITGCDVSCSPKLLSSVANDTFVPRAGKYRHEMRTKNPNCTLLLAAIMD